MNSITLKPREDRRLANGHLWIFSNEIAKVEGSVTPGALVHIKRYDGHKLGIGYYNPQSLIAARLITRNPDATLDKDFFIERIRRARLLREKLYPGSTAYRLLHAESDGVPGVIVDRYNDHFVLQSFALGADLLLPDIFRALELEFHPASITEKSSSPMRALEGAPLREQVVMGKAETTIISDGQLNYEVDLTHAQKTGFFLDQRENRPLIRPFAKGRMLDLFTHDGGFALHAAQAGSEEVIAIDSSENVLGQAEKNVALNKLSRVTFHQMDIFTSLARIKEFGAFDVISCDPPALVKSKNKIAEGRRAYVGLNAMAISMLRPGGVLATASCSHHIDREMFAEILREAARKAHRRLRILAERSASADHPVLLSMPETRYLTFLLVQAE